MIFSTIYFAVIPESFHASRNTALTKLKFAARRMMHISFMALFLLTSTYNVNANGQNLSDVKISLELSQEPFSGAITKIESSSPFRFVYRDEEIRGIKNISLKRKIRTVEETLTELLNNSGLTFSQLGSKILITSKEGQTSLSASVTDGPIAGLVRDEAGLPVPGATVRIKNTKIAAITDASGRYTLDDVNENDVLVFSFLGYSTLEVTYRGGGTVNATLKDAANTLNEVQVIGYGTTTRRGNTGSVGSVTAVEIGKQPVSNPLASMAGRVSGVLIGQNNGVPGSTVQVQIRGQGTLNSGTIPLYVIDGVPFTNFNGSVPANDNLNSFTTSGASGGISPFGLLNPADIERIDILKDADATAIYGSRGANGVVLITTKKGSSGKVKFNFNLNSGFTEISRFIPVLDLDEYLSLRKQAFANDGVTPNTSNAPDLTVWDQTAATDWQDFLLGGKGQINDFQGSMAGGSGSTRFYFNSGYRRESTIYPGDNDDKRFSSRLTVTQGLPTDRFNATISASYTYNKTTLPTSDVASAYSLPPNLPLYDQDGKLYWHPNFTNPLAQLMRKYNGTTTNLLTNAELSYKILPELKAKVNFGYTATDLGQTTANPASSQNPANNPTSSAVFANTTVSNWIIEPTLDYGQSFGDHNLGGVLGMSFQKNSSNGMSLSATNYSNEALLGSLTNAGTVLPTYNNIIYFKYAALFGRLHYDYKEKYLVNVSFRRDGSSRFGPNNRFHNFGAVGAAWIFSEENFFKDQLSFLSFGKLRSSYGSTGNDQINNYLYLSLYSPTTPYLGNAAMNPSVLPNENIQWELTRKFDVGVELGFFKDKVLFSANYFRNRSSNLINALSLPTQAGYNSYTQNVSAEVENNGLELELNTVNISKHDFSWKTGLNISFPGNKLVSYPGLETSFYSSSYVVGEPFFNLYRLYHFTGVDPQTGQATYEDRNNDGVINTQDRYVADQGTLYYGGFNNTFTYKGFELGVFFQFNHRFGVTKIMNTRPGAMVNQNDYWLGVWNGAGDASNIPGATATSGSPIYTSYNFYTQSDAVYGDASFIKLRTANLAYNLPQEWLKPVKLSGVRVYVQGQNLFTLAKNKYVYDTETQVQGGPSGLGTGTLGQVLPPLRTIVFGANISF